tara:strand:+ start:5682 stop:9416 length:3735 start_codon:yes stop_codon:yes gene_type:complete
MAIQLTREELLNYKEPENNPDFLTYTGGEKDTFGLNDLDQDHNYTIIETQMNDRFGLNEKTHGRQKVIDKWINYNRRLGVANTVSVLTEATHLNSNFNTGDEEKDKTLAEQRQVNSLNSYKLWDNVKGAYDGGSVAQKIDSVYDYGVAIIADPINLLGFGVGKLASGSAIKATSHIAREALELSVKRIMAKAKIPPGTPRSKLPPKVRNEINEARTRILDKAMGGKELDIEKAGEIVSDAGRIAGETAEQLAKNTKRGLKFGFAAETGGVIGIDYIQQKSLMQTGFQDEYSYVNAPLIAGAGFFGYGLTALLPHIKGKVLPQSMAFLDLDKIKMAEASFKKMQREAGGKTNKATIKKLLSDDTALAALELDLKNNGIAAERWAETVRLGKSKSLGAEKGLNDIEGLKGFLLGNQSEIAGEVNFDGMLQIFEKYGLELQFEDKAYKHLSDFITDTIKMLPKTGRKNGPRKEIEKLYKNTLKKLDPAHARAKTLEDGMNILGETSSNAGRTLGIFGQLAKGAKEVMDRKVLLGDDSKALLNELIENELPQNVSKTYIEKGLSKTEEFQNNFIRVLVTHPGTSALNLMGWTQASTLQTGSDMIRGVLYGGRAVLDKIANKDMTADGAVDFGQLSRHMFSLQVEKFKNLINPLATQQEALAVLSQNPKLQKELFRYVSGAVDSKDVSKTLGIDIDDLETEGAVDKYIDFFQTLYGVKAIDVMTKTQEFMYNIDKQIRIKYNMTYKQFMTDTVDVLDSKGNKILESGELRFGETGPLSQYKTEPKHWKLMAGNDYYDIQKVALDDTLRNVFSKSMGGGDFNPNRRPDQMVAKVIEDFRKMPLIGAMIPFGQFFNNTIAFMSDHTGMSLVHRAFIKKEDKRDLMELTTKFAAGMVATGAFMQSERVLMEEGLSWHQDRDESGQVRTRLYDYPLSFWKAMGRIAAHITYGSPPPKEMLTDIVKTFGTENLTRQLGDTADGIYNVLMSAASGEEGVFDTVQSMLSTTGSLYMSGFSRPLDPINQIAAMTMGDAYNEKDRKIGSKFINNSTRYVDTIFDALATLGDAETLQPKYTAQRMGETSDRGVPIGRIFGYRAEAAPTALDRLFSDMGRPTWKSNVKSDIPEADNTVNRLITKHLQDSAARVLADPLWKESTTEDRKRMYTTKVWQPSYEKVMREIYNSGNTDDRRHRLLYKMTKRGSQVKIEDLEKDLKEMGIDKDVTDLTYRELLLLRRFREDEAAAKKETISRVGA